MKRSAFYIGRWVGRRTYIGVSFAPFVLFFLAPIAKAAGSTRRRR